MNDDAMCVRIAATAKHKDQLAVEGILIQHPRSFRFPSLSFYLVLHPCCPHKLTTHNSPCSIYVAYMCFDSTFYILPLAPRSLSTFCYSLQSTILPTHISTLYSFYIIALYFLICYTFSSYYANYELNV